MPRFFSPVCPQLPLLCAAGAATEAAGAKLQLFGHKRAEREACEKMRFEETERKSMLMTATAYRAGWSAHLQHSGQWEVSPSD